MPPQNEFSSLAEQAEPDSKDKEIESLQVRVQTLTDEKYEERFIWIVVLIIIVDIGVFPSMNNWGAPIAILVIEIILMAILAKRLGVEEVTMLLARTIDGWARRRDAKGDDNNIA
ncbi:MAG TPA: hypothetical protein VHY35_01545 [Stellaceae bacterium]|jgi:hypothetical protein|nr:hypothetical protein [Stellaceae bacterium]